MRPLRWLLVIPLALLLGAGPSPEDAGELVDRVVATVENTPITASRVAMEEAIRARIAASPHRPDFGRLLSESVEPLEALIFHEVLRSQPEVQSLSVDEEHARERLRLFERTFEDRAGAASFRQQWGLDRSGLFDYFKESVLLDSFVELSVEFRVTEEEERAYYERNKDRVFGGKAYEEVSGYVAQQVYRLKFEAEYNSWRSRLRASSQKRYIGR